MANANYTPTAAGTVLTGTSGDDLISIDPTSAVAGTYTINAGAGTDTIVFDGELAALTGGGTGVAAGSFGATAANQFEYDITGAGAVTGAGAIFSVGAYEFLTFDNGTVSSNASVTPEQILGDSIRAKITVLGDDADAVGGVGGPLDFELDTILDWNGSSATENAGWQIQSIEGQASSAGAFISIVEDGVVQGRVAVDGFNSGIDVTAENAFHTSITEIGAVKTMEIDVVLAKGTATFTETLTVDVVGVASGADNLFNGAAAADGGYAAGAITSAIDGLGGNDLMTGNDGNDVLFGNDGDDRLWAGLTDTGDDVSIGGAGNDKVGGGAGNDWLIGDGHVGTSTFAAATDGADDLFGADGDDFVIGGTFTDVGDVTAYDSASPLLTVAAPGTTGIVTLGATSVTGTAGDKLWAGAGDDQVVGANGNDRIGLGDGDDIAMGQGGDDEIFAGAGNDSVDGGAGDDTIYGGAGNDSIRGDAGADTIYGGTGNDNLFAAEVTAAVDTFVFEAGDGNDTIFGFDQTAGSRDVVDLSALGITGLSDLVTVDDGTDFIVFYGQSDSITFDSMAGLITGADFLFA